MLTIAVTWVLWVDVLRRIDELAVTRSDNIQWTISQLEVDYLRLALALDDVQLGADGALARLRQRFDILYSRWHTLERAEAYRALLTDAEYQDASAEIDTFLDRGVPLIDGPDEELLAAMPRMRADLAQLHAPVRTTALRGLQLFAEVSDRQRAEIVNIVMRSGLITVFLLAALAVASLLTLQAGRRAQRAARETVEVNRNLSMIVNTSLDAIVVADTHGVVRTYNPAAESIFGWSAEEAVGRRMTDLMIPDHHRAAHDAGMKRYLKTGKPRVIGAGRVRLDARHKSGRIFPVEVAITSERNETGHVFVAFLRDITHRRKAEDDLRSARDEALAAARKKAEFLAVMSHEIRTPLNGILGASELLSETPLDPGQAQLLGTMRTSGKLLRRHVDDVLDFSRLETGTVDLRSAPVDLRDLFAEVIDGQMAAAEQAGNRLLARVEDSVPRRVLADRRRLGQVLLNLVGNAIKFTSQGEIVLSMKATEPEPGPDDRASLVINVTDTGIGIPAEDRERIFEDFVMLDSSYDRNAMGTGLGLAITRRLVQAMGGQIEVRDTPGGGADFRIELSFELAGEPSPGTGDGARSADVASGSFHILIVEDNTINRDLLRAMLERDGHTVHEAPDGGTGVALAARVPVDAILMDVSMPGLDGVEATRAIRGGNGPNARTPIIAVTAHALDEDVKRFRLAGMDRTLTKPIDRARLKQLLAELCAGWPAEHDPPPAAGAPASAGILDTEAMAELGEALGEAKFLEMLGRLRKDAAALMETVQAADPQGDPGDLVAAIHKVSGAAGMLGVRALQAELAAIEARQKDTGAVPDAKARARLSMVWDDTRKALDELLD